MGGAGSLAKFRTRKGNFTINSLDRLRKLRVTPELLAHIDFTPNPDFLGEPLGPEGENLSGGDTVDTPLVGNQGETRGCKLSVCGLNKLDRFHVNLYCVTLKATTKRVGFAKRSLEFGYPTICCPS